MKNQYLAIFSISILTISLLTINYISTLKFYYPVNIPKYLAEDFRMKLLIDENLTNITYYNFCLEMNFTCYSNSTHIIFITDTKKYIIKRI